MDDYKNANLTISKNCKKISEMLLVKIDGKRVYDNLEFEEEQVRGFLSCKVRWRHGARTVKTALVYH